MKPYFLLWLGAAVIFSCKNDKGPGQDDTLSSPYSREAYREAGINYVNQVQSALGKTLQQKIRQEGVEGAIEFCNLKALAIADSLSTHLGVEIDRITDRPRNPVNHASAEELEFISQYRDQHSVGATPKPLILRQDGRTFFYAPIMTNDLCLKCHGLPESDISPEVFDKLKELYPEDRATGYSANDLRGLWKVAFTDNNP